MCEHQWTFIAMIYHHHDIPGPWNIITIMYCLYNKTLSWHFITVTCHYCYTIMTIKLHPAGKKSGHCQNGRQLYWHINMRTLAHYVWAHTRTVTVMESDKNNVVCSERGIVCWKMLQCEFLNASYEDAPSYQTWRWTSDRYYGGQPRTQVLMEWRWKVRQYNLRTVQMKDFGAFHVIIWEFMLRHGEYYSGR